MSERRKRDEPDLQRRGVLQAAGIAIVGGLAAAAAPAAAHAAFAEPLDHMSPAFPRMMHICFHLGDDVDFNQFIADLEAESARRGMTQVRANRVMTVTTEQERLAAPIEANSNSITEGQSNGWTLIFDGAREARQKALGR